MKKLVLLFALTISAFSSENFAQSAPSENRQKQDKTFVSVPVAVSDREGRYISGLKKDDFTIFQDGVKQNISFFATYEEPLNIAILLDTSGSTTDSLKKIKDAAGDFIDLLNPEDKCLLATFDYQLKTLNPFTSDRQTLKKSLGKLASADRDGTLLYNSIDKVSRELFADVQGRKVLVLLSDGKDLGSSLSKSQLLSRLEESDVMIYSIFYDTTETAGKVVATTADAGKEKNKKQRKPKKKKGVYSILIPAQADQPNEVELELQEKKAELQGVNSLKEISDLTAGRFYTSDTPKLGDVFKKAAAEMRQQYRLGYQTTESVSGKSVYDIIVKVERPGAIVRARPTFRAKK